MFFWLSLLLSAPVILAQQAENKNTTIFWDVSISMKDRDLEKELSILDKVFQRAPDQEVQLVLFNISPQERTYRVRGGNWDELRKDLAAATYDGANNYAVLKGLGKHPNIYLFTDGNRVFEKDTPDLPAKSFLINSSPYRDEEFLKRTALINRYRLMDFAAILPENIGSLRKNQSSDRKLIRGKVYVDNVPFPDVVIAVKGVSGGVRSVVDGSFSIEAQPGDSLLVSSRSRNTYKVVPVEDTEQMNIFLEANVFTLDEVVLVEKRQEAAKQVTTAYGKENEDKVGYAVQTIDDESITPIQTDVSQAVMNKFSNVNLRNDEDLSRATMRSNTSILGNNYGLVVIDGVPQRQSDSSRDGVQQFAERQNSQTSFDYVNPDNIASISVLKGYAATNKYGSLGANGVILITTKTALASKQTGAPTDLARLTDNIYTENGEGSRVRRSALRQALERTNSTEEAYKTYLELRSASESDMDFFFDAFDYFKAVDAQKAAVITSSILELFPKDIKTLKAVALALSELGRFEEVIRINEEIKEINQNHVQAYLDIAVAKKNLGAHQEALQKFLALQGNSVPPSLNVSSIAKTVNRELKNLIFQRRAELNTINVPATYLNNIKYNVRLVFEWNDPEAEFNLQFVNPQKRYFNWEHNSTDTAERMKDEILNGYSSEEFEFYGEGVQGQWMLNATYINHIDITNQVPFVLKCTLYQNFGYPSQSVKEIVTTFNAPNETKQIATILVE